MIKSNITIIIFIEAIVLLAIIGFFAADFVNLFQSKQTEIQQIQELAGQAQESGIKEPLITISQNGFSQEEIEIKANSFISFYNSTDKDIEINSKTIKPGATSSMKFKENTEIKFKDKILKIILE